MALELRKLKIDREPNKLIVNNYLEMELVTGDSIMVLEDDFVSSYDCKACKGSGVIKKTCAKCEGAGKNRFGTDCSECSGLGFFKLRCELCEGKGALLAIPEIAKGRPTSGTIVSLGPDCVPKWWWFLIGRKAPWRLDDRVCYTSYTGHLLPFRDNYRVRVMRQTEPLCKLKTRDQTQEISEDLAFVDTDTPYEMR